METEQYMCKRDEDAELLISFIMPVYNNTKYSPNAIESIMSQNSENIELVVVDDGSTDGTSELLDEISKQYSNMHVLHQKNQWVYASMNNGILAAKGKYIYIVNSDDKITSNSVTLFLSKIHEYNNPDVIYTKVKTIFCNEEQEEIKPSVDSNPGIIKEAYYKTAKEYRENWFFLLKTGLLNCEKQIIKRIIALQHPFRNDWYSADVLFNTQVADDINTAVVLPDDVYMFHQYNDITMNISKGKYYEYESKMRNEIFSERYQTLLRWGLINSDILEYLIQDRLRGLSGEVKRITRATDLTTCEKTKRILNISGEIIERFKVVQSYREELECRCLSGLNMLFTLEKPDPRDEYYFAFKMLNSFLKVGKSDEDFNEIEKGINHGKNTYHIGLALYSLISSDVENQTSIGDVRDLLKKSEIQYEDFSENTIKIKNKITDNGSLLIGLGKEQVRVMARIKGYTFLKISVDGKLEEIVYSRLQPPAAKCFGFDNIDELKEFITIKRG